MPLHLIASVALLVTVGSPLNDHRLIPGVRAGPIRANTSLHALEQMFGKQNVRPSPVPSSTGAEGDEEPGLELFPDDPARKMLLWWRRPERAECPAAVEIQGRRSRWTMEGGISLGTSLAELNRLNGGPFRLLGFDWDGGGCVRSWEGGRLERLLPFKDMNSTWLWGLCLIATAPVPEVLVGDKELSSDDPALAGVRVIVDRVSVKLKGDACESDASDPASAASPLSRRCAAAPIVTVARHP